MECFKHDAAAAVGLCKFCYKALCRDCATEHIDGLSCSETCATQIREINEMNERGKKIYGIGARKSRIPATGVLLWGLLASSMWLVFLLPYFSSGLFELSNLIVAVLFTVAWGLTYYSSKRTGLQC